MNQMLYRQEREENQNFIPAPFDPGTTEYLKTGAQTALYHSPFMGVYRATELALEEWDWTNPNSEKISPEEATQKYGMDGLLKFDEPIHPGAADLMMKRKQAELAREHTLTSGATGPLRKLGGLGVSLAATLIDPINLASMFVPVVGEARFARLVQMTGGSMVKARLIAGAIEGAVGAAMVEPFILLPAMQEQANYTLKDSAVNMGFGAILGGAMHAAAGAIGDRIISARNTRFSENMVKAKRIIDTLDPDSQDELFTIALSDFVQDKPVTSPMEAVELAEPMIETRAKWDAAEARRDALHELGFDTTEPDTFNLYPDGSIADPKPNEPWFHGRAEGQLIFDLDRPAFFTRNLEAATYFGDDNIFVTNLDIRNPATISDLIEVIDSLGLDDIEISSRVSDLPEYHMIGSGSIDAVFLPEVIAELKSRGFDSLLVADFVDSPETGSADLDEVLESFDTLIVWDPNKVKTPGRKPTKTDKGLLWVDGKEQKLSLEKRIKDLKEARVKNLIEKKRKEFRKAQDQQARATQIDEKRVVSKEAHETRNKLDDAIEIDRQTKEIQETWYHGIRGESEALSPDRPLFLTNNKDIAQTYANEIGEGVFLGSDQVVGKTVKIQTSSLRSIDNTGLMDLIEEFYGQGSIDKTTGHLGGRIEIDFKVRDSGKIVKKNADLVADFYEFSTRYYNEGGISTAERKIKGNEKAVEAVKKHSTYKGDNYHDVLYDPKFREFLESKGFDSVRLQDSLFGEPHETLVVWGDKVPDSSVEGPTAQKQSHPELINTDTTRQALAGDDFDIDAMDLDPEQRSIVEEYTRNYKDPVTREKAIRAATDCVIRSLV